MSDSIYKILTSSEWDGARRAGVFDGSAVDRADGYIHFSTAAQARETAAKHFTGQTDLVLELMAAWTLSGRVFSSESVCPLAWVDMVIRVGDGQIRTQTDAGGRFSAALPLGVAASVTVVAEGRAPALVSEIPPGAGDLTIPVWLGGDRSRSGCAPSGWVRSRTR